MATDPDSDKLKSLGERVEKARKTERERQIKTRKKSDKSIIKAYKIGVELMVAMFVGLALGIFIDRTFGTAPIFIIIFFFLGVAAGFRNVYKAAQTTGSRGSSEDEE